VKSLGAITVTREGVKNIEMVCTESEAMMTMTKTQGLKAFPKEDVKDSWFVDSGATEHMFDCCEWMTNFMPIMRGSWLVAIVDDSQHWVHGTGDVHILRGVEGVQKKGVLKGALYIPHLRRNLFSVRQVTTQGIVTLFDEDVFTMIDKNVDGATLMDGHLDGKM
jgi:hypothetical protein